MGYLKLKTPITINPSSYYNFHRLIIFFISRTTISFLTMFGVAVVDIEATFTTVAKWGPDRPRGSNNKVKAISTLPSPTVPGKHRHGHPLDSKNKVKAITAVVGSSTGPVSSSTEPSLPHRMLVNLFRFFTFPDA
jgi:hypothetical protein